MNEKRQNYFFIMHFHVGQLLCGKIRSFVVFLQVVRYTSSKNKRSATSRDVPPATLLPKRCVYICVCVRKRANAFVWKITSVAIARARVNVSSAIRRAWRARCWLPRNSYFILFTMRFLLRNENRDVARLHTTVRNLATKKKFSTRVANFWGVVVLGSSHTLFFSVLQISLSFQPLHRYKIVGRRRSFR